MTSLRGHDVIRCTLNLAYDTCQSIIFQTWGRKLPYLISCGSYLCYKVVHFRRKIFARKFACTWNAQRVNKFDNVLHIYSPIRCDELLKISDQLVVIVTSQTLDACLSSLKYAILMTSLRDHDVI